MNNEAYKSTINGETIEGPVRAPRNSAAHLGRGSIHDNDTAKELGFRGGTVAGSLHMEQFPPLLMEVFGDEWLNRGGLSLYFRYPTTDGEPVQAFARQPVAGQGKTAVWMHDTEGHLICEGTATLGGPDADSTVRQRIAAVQPPSDIRILANAEIGVEGPVVPVTITSEMLDKRLSVVTEALPAYTDAAIFGKRVITPALQVQAMRPGESALLPRDDTYGVGLFGAIELQAINGPVFADHPYESRARILAIGETPKTEFFFYESILDDADNGNEVMRMLMMIRFMKASSSHYQ